MSFSKRPDSDAGLRNPRDGLVDEDTYPSFLRDDGTVADPTKVNVEERERAEEEAKLLDSTVGRVVPLLLVASARLKNELGARVERLFDEGGSADQKLRGDYGAYSEASMFGKSPSALKELLANSLLNVEVGVTALPTLPMVTSLVSTTLEHESGAPAESITGCNIRIIGASERSAVVPSVITEAVVTSHAANVSPVPKMGVKVTSPIREMDYHHLFTEFNVGIARQACLNAEVRMRTEYCLSEKKRLESEREKQADLVHALEATCSGLRERLSGYKNLADRLEEFQNAQLKVVNDKVAKLDADLAEMACHLEKLYPHLLTTISGQRWLITHGLKLVLVKCLNSSEYLTALGAAISRPLADAPGMGDLQPDIEQPKVPIHMPEDQVVLGETSLSFSLSVSHSRVEQIRANITAERSALLDVWTPLSKPLSVQNLIGEASTSASVPASTVTTMALSTTFSSTSLTPPITVDDYEFVHADLDTTQESS
nr:hypothetical protein [Tanacetum cinerariifolium]